MNLRSIRVRLAGWYFLSLAVILTLFAVGCRLAMEVSIYHALDHEVALQMDAVEQFLKHEAAGMSAPELQDELSELAQGGIALAVSDAGGQWIYRSDFFTRRQPPVFERQRGQQSQFKTLRMAGHSYRLAFRRIAAGEHIYLVTMAMPLNEFDESLERFETVLLVSAPLVLLVASVGGFWLSQRALAPVDRIIGDARSITFNNLSARLEVPSTGDELQRLSMTINEMLARIESSVARIQQFTADASHELRAPLTLIRTAADFSLRRDREREDLLDALRKILAEAERTTHLLDNLMTLSRADSGMPDVEFAAVNLNDATREAAERAKASAEAQHLDYQVELPEAPVTVYGDIDALRRAVFVLIENAVKYTAPGGRVVVRLAAHGDTARVTVEDTGTGIAAEDLPRVFDRFWRADKVRSRSAGGVGLGLAIAQSTAKRHGGSIEVESRLNQGSKFTLVLPIHA